MTGRPSCCDFCNPEVFSGLDFGLLTPIARALEPPRFDGVLA